MIKLLSIASGKTTAQQEAEAGDIPYSQYIKQKEAEQKENTAENGGEVSEKTVTEGGEKYSIKYPTFSEEEMIENAIQLQEMEPVKELTGEEFPKSDIPLRKRIMQFFDSLGNNVSTELFGDVALTSSSVHDDLGHGTTNNKVVSFAAVPEVIQKGVVIDSQSRGGNNYDRIVVAAPIKIGSEEYVMGVMLQRDHQSQRLYLHDIVSVNKEETTQNLETTPSSTEVSKKGNSLYMTSILQKALSVKKEYMQEGKNNTYSTKEISQADKKKQAERKEKVKSLCDLFGLSLEWDEGIKRGKYNPDTRTVFINPNLTLTEMYIEVLKHEFTHDLENRKLYKGFKEFLFVKSINFRDYCETALKNDYGEELKGAEAIKKLTELKYRDYMSSEEMSDKEKAAFDTEAAEREIIADFVANRLLGGIGTDGKFEQEAYEALKELSEYHRSGFQRFVDWIKELINKIKGQPTFKDMADELEYLNKQIAKVYDSRINESSNNTIKFSLMNLLSFSQNVDNILKMSDDEADKNKKEGNFVSILKKTPQIILDNVKGAEDLEIIISFHSLYLETRHEGCLEGTYHNLGEQIKQLPELISNPEAIVRMKDGRINILTTLETSKGKHGTISVELSTVKDINNKNDKYNLVITVFSSKDSYILNNLLKNGDYVEYKKEDLSQVNPQLHKSLTTFNEKSSIDSIPDNSNTVKEKSDSTGSHSIAVPFSEEFKAEKRKKYAEGLVKKYGGDINGAELENYLKEISAAADNNSYSEALKIAHKMAQYISENSAKGIQKTVHKNKIKEIFNFYICAIILIFLYSEINSTNMLKKKTVTKSAFPPKAYFISPKLLENTSVDNGKSNILSLRSKQEVIAQNRRFTAILK